MILDDSIVHERSNSRVRQRFAFDASSSLSDKLLNLVTPGWVPLDVLYEEVKLGANASTDLAERSDGM